ncbi:Sel-1 1 protein, partial [Globisporangium splendens]
MHRVLLHATQGTALLLLRIVTLCVYGECHRVAHEVPLQQLLTKSPRSYRDNRKVSCLSNSDACTSMEAATLMQASADQFGTPRAQFLLAALSTFNTHGNDLHDNDAETILYHHFGARGGSIASSMALGYRHLRGAGVQKSCDAALNHYKFAADRVKSAHTARTRHPIQMFTSQRPFRLSDNARSKPPCEQDDAHRMEYLRQRAWRSSDPVLLENAASVVLFSDFHQGEGVDSLVQHQTLEAKTFLERAAQLGSFSAKALLAHIYAYGIRGFPQDVAEALRLYQEALNESSIANNPNAEAANGLGLVYFHGLGDVDVDYERAMRLFQVSARSGHADGVYNAGVLLFQSHPQRAQEYLEASANVGHLPATFKLARLKERTRLRLLMVSGTSEDTAADASSCEEIVKLYKKVAEQSEEGLELLSTAATAFLNGDREHALVLYLIAAEMGYEVAESNAAWLLERPGFFQWLVHKTQPNVSVDTRMFRQLVLRGVAQESADAYVRYGDLLFSEGKYALAMRQYERADEVSNGKHARALFNIGYTHEHGLGVAMRSLEKASHYYELVRSSEPALYYVMTLLKWKLSMQVRLAALIERISTVKETLTQRWIYGSERPEVSTDNAGTGCALSPEVADPRAGDAIAHPDRVTFASALAFDSDSKLQLEVRPLAHATTALTIETWINIHADYEGRRTHMVLLDWQDLCQLELVRGHQESSWRVRFRTKSLLIDFPHGHIHPGAWTHITVAVAFNDEEVLSSTLYVNRRVVDHGKLRLPQTGACTSLLTANDARILSVGSSLTRSVQAAQVDPTHFVGRMMNLRIWQTPTLPADISTLLHTAEHKVPAPELLLVQLQIGLRTEQESMTNEDTSGVTILDRVDARGEAIHVVRKNEHVRLAIERFPPKIKDSDS